MNNRYRNKIKSITNDAISNLKLLKAIETKYELKKNLYISKYEKLKYEHSRKIYEQKLEKSISSLLIILYNLKNQIGSTHLS